MWNRSLYSFVAVCVISNMTQNSNAWFESYWGWGKGGARGGRSQGQHRSLAKGMGRSVSFLWGPMTALLGALMWAWLFETSQLLFTLEAAALNLLNQSFFAVTHAPSSVYKW